MAAGAITGWLFGQAMTAIAWLGPLFLDALKMLIVPLIAAAVVSGVASLGDVRRLGRIGALTIFYFLATTMTAVLIGLVLVNLFEPGAGLSIESGTISESLAAKQDIGFSDILLSLVTPNLVAAAAERP